MWSDNDIDQAFQRLNPPEPDPASFPLDAWLRLETQLDEAVIARAVRRKLWRYFAAEVVVVALVALGWLLWPAGSTTPAGAEVAGRGVRKVASSPTPGAAATRVATGEPAVGPAATRPAGSTPTVTTTPSNNPSTATKGVTTTQAAGAAAVLPTPADKAQGEGGRVAISPVRAAAPEARRPRVGPLASGPFRRRAPAVAPMTDDRASARQSTVRQGAGTEPAAVRTATVASKAAMPGARRGAIVPTTGRETNMRRVAALNLATRSRQTVTMSGREPKASSKRGRPAGAAATAAAGPKRYSVSQSASGFAAVDEVSPHQPTLLAPSPTALPAPLPTIALAPTPPTAPDATEPRPRPRLFVGVVAAPDLSTVKFATVHQPLPNVGVVLEYRLTPRLRLTTGLLRATKQYDARRNDYDWSKYPRAYYRDFALVKANCTVLDVPLNLRYDLVTRPRYAVFGGVGLSSFFIQREVYSYNYVENNLPAVWERGVVNENRHLFSILNLSVGYERRLGRHWSAQAEPYLKLPLAGVGAGRVRLTSAGVFFGLKYGF